MKQEDRNVDEIIQEEG